MISVAIIHGWAEGQWQSRLFRKTLENAGYKVVKDPHKSDIIIAHSEGCYWVPRETRAKLIVLIGLPYWPGRSLATAVVLNLKTNYLASRGENSTAYWLAKLSTNIWYFFTRPNLTYKVATVHKPANLPDKTAGKKIILLRNQLDTFSHPRIHQLLSQTKKFKSLELAGVHDDCWRHPEKYVQLIEKEYN